jgi:hypothetical protein
MEDDDDDDDRPRRPRRRREDDDLDDRPIRKSSGGSGTTIALIFGGVILGIFLICGGVVLYIYTSVKKGVQEVQAKVGQDLERMRVEAEQRRIEQEAKDAKRAEEEKNSDYGRARSAAEAIMQNVKARRIEAIHEGATPAYQKRTTVEQLKTLIETNKDYLDAFRKFEKDFGEEPPLSGSTYLFSQQLQTAFGFRKVKITMVKEGTEWKMDQIIVENRL